jgi:hypothetical protein
MMEEQFPVNSGNVPPPSQSTNLLIHQLQNTKGRRKPQAPKSTSKVTTPTK